MPSTTVSSQNSQKFRVTMMHHPAHWVPDLDEAEQWFERVFRRSGTSIAEVLKRVPYVRSDWPRDYSVYTPISDVFFDSVEPARFVVGGKQYYDTVDKPHLQDFGWYVDGHTEAYRQIKRAGIQLVNTLREVLEGDEPTGPNDPAPFFTVPDEMGMRYHFYPGGPFPVDARTQPGWELPPASAADPLGIERCSHHTVLTKQPERALKLYVEALGGEIIHEGRNELLGANSTYVHIGGTTLEYAVPDEGTEAHDDWALNNPRDTYHAISWKVVDLEGVERHLETEGVRIRARSDDTIVTDPPSSLGIPWGFSVRLVPGDPRGTD
jgi:catechol 2,3-dioxygenase-like lactoylglutathione lyase family enzyme